MLEVLQGCPTLIEHLFGFDMAQDLTCPDCHVSRTYQPDHILRLPLVRGHKDICCSLEESMDLVCASDEFERSCGSCARQDDLLPRLWCACIDVPFCALLLQQLFVSSHCTSFVSGIMQARKATAPLVVHIYHHKHIAPICILAQAIVQRCFNLCAQTGCNINP